MKMKYIKILISIILIFGLGSCIYFVSQFSAVYPPIKKYKFKTNVANLRLAITETLDNPDKYEYKFKDTVGNKENGFAYYVDLRIKNTQMDNDYTFKFYEFQRPANNSSIDLIGAFDKINKTGGYKIKDNDVPRLIDLFDKEFISDLTIKLDKN